MSRFESLDILRGVAVLAIFAVNIKMMANGYNHYRDVSLWEGDTAQWIGLLQARLIDGKFLTIFTALFGAGLALLLAREKPVRLPIVLRRLLWLTVFGALHLTFLREGDILVWYALAGLGALAFVKLPPGWLLIAGICLQVAAWLYYTNFPLNEASAPILWSTAPDAHDMVAQIMLGSLGEQVAARLEASQYYMIDLFLKGGVWIDTLGTMVIGMALLKTGYLTGQLRSSEYLVWGSFGLVVASAYYLLRPFVEADNDVQIGVLSVLGYLHRFGGALAWSALIIGAIRIGWRSTSLSAVGRSAFTVYILQSVIGLVLFSSLGFGLFGQVSLPGLMGIVVIVWAASPIAARFWFAHYRFGPLEWLWRSLTYQEKQPFLRSPQ